MFDLVKTWAAFQPKITRFNKAKAELRKAEEELLTFWTDQLDKAINETMPPTARGFVRTPAKASKS